jgi:membrane-associated protease RseP (regulator of RpoE activity)
MIQAVGWLLFFVALIACVLLHEAGHFVTAKAFGMKATQFFAGFGPTLWSVRRGETEYGFKAIPAGGFVKIVGMTPLEDIPSADEPRAFYRQKAWKRTIVLAAGSFMHFVIAFGLLFAIVLLVGRSDPTLTVDQVTCVNPPASGQCALGAPAPAKAAGLQPGDQVVAYAGTRVTSWDGLVAAIHAHGAAPAQLTVLRDGRERTLTVTPVETRTAVGTAPKIGVQPTVLTTHYGPASAVARTGRLFGSGVALTFESLGKIPGAIPKLYSNDRSADDSPASPIGVGKLAGDALASSGSASAAAANFLSILVSLNVFIGIFNLLPLLPLDGGHLAIVWFERVRSGVARVLGRPDPGRVDLTKVMPVAYFVIVLFVGLSVLLLGADIVNPVSNPF